MWARCPSCDWWFPVGTGLEGLLATCPGCECYPVSRRAQPPARALVCTAA